MVRSHYHPDLYLLEHVAQVRKAADYIWSGHSSAVASVGIKRLTDNLIALHDLGKAGAAFQEYIAGPQSYTGDPADKAHAPLSTMLALLMARAKQDNRLEALGVAAAALGHHRGFPTVEKLCEIGSGFTASMLKRQVETLDWGAVENVAGGSLAEIKSMKRPWAMAQRYLREEVLPQFERLPLDEAVDYRLRTQLMFSVLLEADKAFLAVTNPDAYLKREPRHWRSDWVEKKLGAPAAGGVNALRQEARGEFSENMRDKEPARICALTAPTGIGKTLLAATWALKTRETFFEQLGRHPRIVVVLPFLSIIDQTVREYEALLEIGGYAKSGAWLLASHSLSERQYEDDMDDGAERFFIDTWRTELVITTYDQFLLSLLDPKARYQMRFHNLCDALIILDEVQSLPCRLWAPLAAALEGLTRIGNSRVLLMSATLPAFMSGAEPLLKSPAKYFERCERYELHLNPGNEIDIDRFCEDMCDRLRSWVSGRKRVLITLNTRQSARLVRDALQAAWPRADKETALLFITADVTPNDRLAAISRIKTGAPCVVVATQCIEAGVDIDMDIVVRDFGPLDSLIQIAGRCNREGRRASPGQVEIVDIIDSRGRRYADLIYDEVHLAQTRRVLDGQRSIKESEILPLADAYFERLSTAKDTGEIHTKRFARWEEDISVRELLRGKDREEYSFLVIAQDPKLKSEMAKAQNVEDRWARREAWRKLAARMARIAVTVYAKRGFHPEDIATRFLGNWLLRDGFYKSGEGLVIPSEADQAHTFIF